MTAIRGSFQSSCASNARDLRILEGFGRTSRPGASKLEVRRGSTWTIFEEKKKRGAGVPLPEGKLGGKTATMRAKSCPRGVGGGGGERAGNVNSKSF